MLTPSDALSTVNSLNLSDGIVSGENSTVVDNVPASNNKPQDLPGMTLGIVDVRENVGMAELPIRLSSASDEVVTVNFTTIDTWGTAVAGEDYLSVNGTIVFQPGETEKTIRVPILDDAVREDDEDFLVRVSVVSGAKLGFAPAGNHSLVSILSNDALTQTR